VHHFDYIRATTCAEAVQLLADASRACRLLAGGTDLLVLRHKGDVAWELLVDISRVAEMRRIRETPANIVVGAAVTHAEVWESEPIRAQLPVLAAACHSIGSPQIRNRGTLGGNVANAAACADSMPALVCLGAQAHLLTPAGPRVVPVGDIVKQPGQTALPAGALIREFAIPRPSAGSRTAHVKVGRRQAQSIARLSLACLGRLDEAGCVAELRIVPGACTPQTQRFDQAEAVLLGERPSEKLVRQAGVAATQQMVAIAGRRWSTAYKEPALAALVERALRRVLGLPEVA